MPDGSTRVRPSRGAKSPRQRLSADLDELGIELWTGRSPYHARPCLWILAPEQQALPFVRLEEAARWAAGMYYGIRERGRLVRRYRAYHRTTTEDAVRAALVAGADE